MSIFDSHMEFVNAYAKRLCHSGLMAFGASCCERAFPNYVLFHRNECWGEPRLLRLALDSAWEYVSGKELSNAQIESLSRDCEEVIPDSGDFPSVVASSAQDAGFSLIVLLELASDPDPKHLSRIITFSRDTIERYIEESENLQAADVDFDLRIDRHPLTTAEVSKQRVDLEWLSIREQLTLADVTEFQQRATIGGRSNLGVLSS